MKKKYIIISTIVVFVLSISLILMSINTDIKKLERRVAIELPESVELIYYKNNIGWFGEGGILSVVQFDDKSNRYIIDLFQELDSEEEKLDPMMTEETFQDDVEHALDTFVRDVDLEYYPEWNHNYVWKYTGNDIYWIFDQDSYQLFIIELVW